MQHAFNIHLADERVHAYAQRYCFLNGPDPDLNRELLAQLLAARVPLAEESDAARVLLLSAAEQRAIARECLASLKLDPALGVAPRVLCAWADNLAWKVRKIPAAARDVLVLGSASCREAIFIRQQLPAARISCVDFEDARLPQIERSLGIEFHCMDFHELLADRAGQFDAVFSNHVLEHLFKPAHSLALIKRALRPGGCLVSALPLDGQPQTPFSTSLNRAALHPLDLCTVDLAHAWKTNVTDLAQHLRAAGFSQLEFSGRDQHFSVAERRYRDRAAFERRARLGLRLNRILFGSAREALKRVFPERVPGLVLKTVFGVEHRVWFGSNRLKNEFSFECLVVAR